MRLSKLLILGLLLTLLAVNAQAGYLTPGLENLLLQKENTDVIKVLVVLNDQVDVKTMDYDLHDAKADLGTRHKLVLESLQDKARATQADLLSSLESRKASGGIQGYTSHWIVNAVVVQGTVEAITDLAKRDDVERIEPDLVVELIEPFQTGKHIAASNDGKGIGLTPGLTAMGVPQVWNDLGIDGTGVIVGVLDTGVDGTHPALASRWQGNFAPAEHCWLDAADLGDTSFPVDQHYHGTHVMGTVTGLAEGDTIGVAPGAHWIASNIINGGTGVTFDNGVIASLEFMADPDGNPETTADMPAVVQNSWGVNEGFDGYVDCDSRWWDAIDNCEAAGVVLVWSAGNEGPGSETLRSPGDRATSPTSCFSVGSTEHTAPYTISDFSSRGPSGCGGIHAMKPEVVAPGSSIYSAEPGGGYQYLDGTSMSGPHVAGVVALMRAANPDLDVITIKETLMATATDLGVAGEDNIYGHGFVNAYAAVVAVMGDIGTVAGTVTDSGTGLPIAGVMVSQIGGNATRQTDENGQFSLMIPAGATSLTFNYFAYDEGTLNITVVDGETVDASISLVTSPAGIISGLIYGPEGELVEGAVIQALGTPVAPVQSDATGHYEISMPIADGVSYDLIARSLGLGYQIISVPATGDLVQDFNLPLLYADDFESGGFLTFPWEMNSNIDWIINEVAPFEGRYCASSATTDHNQQAEMEVTVEVAQTGNVSFWYKVGSEDGYDYLRFYLDDVQVEQWSGSIPWTLFTYEVPAGEHTFKWAFEKDGSVSSNGNQVSIDLLEFPTLIPPTYPTLEIIADPISVTVALEGTTTVPLVIGNAGENDLDYSVQLLELEGPPAEASVNPIPFLALAKGVADSADPATSFVTDKSFGGPDGFGYSWLDSDEFGGPVYNWVDISATGTDPGGADDTNLGPFDLGFNFSYYGATHNSVRICTNGWLSFTSTDTDYLNQGIPLDSEPNNLVAVFWDDFTLNDGGNIYYLAEADRFIVQYEQVRHYKSTHDGELETFQVIINRDGSIVYQYQTANVVNSGTVGIENAAGDDGLLLVHNSDYLHTEMAIRFATEPPMTWVQTDLDYGVVAPGYRQTVNVIFDAADLELGIYYAQLILATNDPQGSLVTIPLTLDVGGFVSPVDENHLPKVVQFDGAVPNPFNPITDIKFSLPKTADVSLKLYNVSGRLVRSLVSESMVAGSHQIRWNGQDNGGKSVASGSYFARLVVDGIASVKPLVLVR